MSIDSPYEPPKGALVDTQPCEIKRKGSFVVLDPKAEWPSRCYKCNAETNAKRKVNLTYVNPWIYITFLLAALLTIILYFIFRKRFSIVIPLCETHIKKRKRYIMVQWGMVGLAIAFAVLGILTEDALFISVVLFILLITVFIALFCRLATAIKYKNYNVWLAGAGKKFLNSLPDYSD